MKVEITRSTARLRDQFVSASAALRERALLVLRLEDGDGHVGYGEAAPLREYDGVSLEDCQAALEDCREVLSQSGSEPREVLLAQCRRRAVLPQAVAAVDLALWDLAGSRARQPVWRLLGAAAPARIEVNYTISAPDRAGASAEAAFARQQGYRAIKLKVGTGDDAGRLAAVRAAAGPELAIRLDANGVWSVAEARAALCALAPAGIELCEEPVRGVEHVAALAASTAVPLAIDETAAAPGALERRVCSAVCLKVARCGGISGLLGAGRQARAVGYEVYLASTLDGPLGIAAALHAAAVLAPDRPSGLATLQLFDGRGDPFPPSHGEMTAPSAAGLGSELRDWYGP